MTQDKPTSWKLNIELDEDTGAALRRLMPHGSRKAVFGKLAKELVELLEISQETTIVGIMQGRIVARLEVLDDKA